MINKVGKSIKLCFKGCLCFVLAILFINDELYAEAQRYFKEASEYGKKDIGRKYK